MRENLKRKEKESKETYKHANISASRMAIPMKSSTRSLYWFALVLKYIFCCIFVLENDYYTNNNIGFIHYILQT